MQRNRTILVIVDDSGVGQLVDAHLASENVRIIAAQDGGTGLEHIRRGGIDLVLLDLDLPDCDVATICRARVVPIPVVILIASNDPEDRQRAFDVGGVDYVTKPIMPEELRRRIDSILRIQELDAIRAPVEKKSRLHESEAGKFALRNSERLLHEQREVLTNVLATIPYAVYWKDREGRYQGGNDTFARSIGAGDSGEIVGRLDDELPGESREIARRMHEDIEVMRADQPLLDVERSQVLPDGSTVTVLSSRLPLHDCDNAVAGLVGIDADITDRKRVEDTLRASEAKLHAITSQLPALLWTTNNELEVNSILGAMVRQRDNAIGAVTGTHVARLANHLRIDVPQAFVAAHETAIDGEPTQFEVECDGRSFNMRIEPLIGVNDAVVGTLGLALDVTEQRLAEEAERQRQNLEESINAMEQVLGVIGHELRTPLAGLRVMSEYLLSSESDECGARTHFVASINKEVIRLADMVNNLLETARASSGRARWNWTEFDIQETCEHAMKLIEPLVDERRVKLHTVVELEDTRMCGDADAVHRLLVNLLSNAQKHTGEGRISIALRETRDHNGRWIILEVQDTGKGIRDHLREGLGVPFALNSGIVGGDTTCGTGLGLAICRGIAAAHGGEIIIDSELGLGTTVTVRFQPDLAEPVVVERDWAVKRVNGVAA